MIIRNGNLHIGDGTVMNGTDIRVEGKMIAEIGKNLNPDNETEIDAAGMEIFPGFIDPVCAIGCMGIPTRYMDNAELTDPLHPEMDIKYSVDPDELSNQEFYRSGVTTVGMSPSNSNVMGGQISAFKTADMKFAARMVKNKAALKCSVTSAVKENYGEKNTLPMTKMGIFYLLEKLYTSAKMKKEEDLDEKEKVARETIDHKLPVFVAAEKQSEIQAALHFFTEEKIPVTIVDGYEFDRCLPEMKKNNANLILGNLSNLSQKTKHNMKLEQLQELIDNGNLIAFTTTCGGYSEGREVMLWNAIDTYCAGISEEEVVKMLSLNPAKMLGIDHRTGSLEKGKDADIVIYTGHPVTTYQAQVKACMINGEVIYHV